MEEAGHGQGSGLGGAKLKRRVGAGVGLGVGWIWGQGGLWPSRGEECGRAAGQARGWALSDVGRGRARGEAGLGGL